MSAELFVRDDLTGELGEDAFRPATPEEIGASRYAIEVGALRARVGRLEISGAASEPDGIVHSFMLAKDCVITADGKPLVDWGLTESVTLTIRGSDPVRVEIVALPA